MNTDAELIVCDFMFVGKNTYNRNTKTEVKPYHLLTCFLHLKKHVSIMYLFVKGLSSNTFVFFQEKKIT